MARSFPDMSISPDQKVAVTTHNGADLPWKSPEKKFAGLYNPGATCYMNSLLQTLFMTPEFRLKLYSFRYDRQAHGAPANCIPYQLQLLFARLQQTHLSFVETTDLIQSFQWDAADTFIQHDAQEFCRILLDAVEESVKLHPGLTSMVQDLYGGKLMDYLKCCGCGQESSREDSFLDLALTVRSESDNLYNDSLEKALFTYLTPELLDGENQVLCDHCGHKADFRKGFKLKSLPYILMLQLKRFDLDISLMQRRKLNDSVSFPQVLNMNVFFRTADQQVRSDSPPCSSCDSPDSPTVPLSPANFDDRTFLYSSISAAETIRPDPDSAAFRMDAIALRRHRDRKAGERKEKTERLAREYLQEGEQVYELFSVMVHSGSSLGGHYYAYIKCFENYRWYDFDDSRVVEIDEEDVEKAYGGESTLYGTSAYLLMYRKVCPDNQTTVDSSAIPTEVAERVEGEGRTLDLDQILVISIFCLDQQQSITVLKTSSFPDAKRRIFELSHFNPALACENVRLWLFNPQYNLYIRPVDDLESWKMHVVSAGTEGHFLALEMKQAHESFCVFNPQEIRVLLIYNIPVEPETRPFTVLLSLPKDSFVSDLVTLVEAKTGYARFSLHRYVLHKLQTGDLTDLSLRSLSLSQAKIFDGNYIIALNKEELPHVPRTQIHYNDPETDSNALEKALSLPWQSPISELRVMIARELGAEPGNLILRRFKKEGVEVKDGAGVAGEVGMGIYVEIGQAARLDQVRIAVDWAEDVEDEDSHWLSFTEVGKLLIEKSATVGHLKGKICELVRSQGKDVSAEELHVRERLGDRLGKLLGSTALVKDCVRSERCRWAVQQISAQVPLNPLILTFRLWSPASYSLSPCKHLILSSYTTQTELLRLLSRLLQIPSRLLQFYRVPNAGAFSRLGLWKVKWTELFQREDKVEKFPLFLGEAGGLAVVKNAMETVRAPTDEETRLYSWKPLPRIVDVARPKERSVRITVKTDKP